MNIKIRRLNALNKEEQVGCNEVVYCVYTLLQSGVKIHQTYCRMYARSYADKL